MSKDAFFVFGLAMLVVLMKLVCAGRAFVDFIEKCYRNVKHIYK